MTRRWQRLTRLMDEFGLRAWTVAIGALALVTRLAVYVTYDEPPPGRDSREYLALANQLAAGDGFPRDGFRTPGYPGFIAVLQQLPGRREDVVVLVQHLLGVLLVLGILHLTWHFFGRGPALLAALLAALTPNMATLENWVLADFLFGFFAFFAVAALALAIERDGQLKLLIAAGALIAVACYLKPAGQFLIPAVVLAALFATRDLRRTARWSAVMVGVAVVGIAPWVIRTAVHTGQVGLSTQSGVTIFHRLFDVDRQPVPRTEPGGNLARDIQEEVAATGGRCPKSCIVEKGVVDRYHATLDDEFAARGISRVEMLEIEERLATEAIRADPLSYAWNTVELTARVYTDANRFLQYGVEKSDRSSADRVREIGLPGPITFPALAFLAALQALSWAWLVLGILGLIPLVLTARGRARTGLAAVGSGWLFLAGMTAASHGGLWRYSQIVAPLTWILGAAGVAALFAVVRGRLPSRSAPATGDGPAAAVAIDRR